MIDTSNLVPSGTQDQPVWVSGGSYVVGQQVVSPASYKIYVRKTIGGGVTDPSLDGTNWASIGQSTKTIINAYSVAGWTAQTVNAVSQGEKVVLSGALTANTLATVFSRTGGPSEFSTLYFKTTDGTARTMRVKITIDGSVAFDFTSASIAGPTLGMVISGFQNSAVNVVHGPIRSSTSLVIEIASNLTETNKFEIGYIVQELN